MTEMIGDTIQSYYAVRATEKARLKNVTVNGSKATIVFKEYQAPNDLKEEFRKLDNSDGHYYYITIYLWNGCKSYYTGKEISADRTYITTKEEGNEIYKQLKETGEYSFTGEDEELDLTQKQNRGR